MAEYDILGYQEGDEVREDPVTEHQRLVDQARDLETKIYVLTDEITSNVRRLSEIRRRIESLSYKLP